MGVIIKFFNLLKKEELKMTKLMLRPFRSSRLLPTAFPTDVFEDFDRFFNLDRFFEGLDLFDSASNNLSLRGFPRGDIFVEDKHLNLEFALAGYSKDQLSIQVSPENNQILISAEKKDDEEKGNGRSLARRSFKKTVEVLPQWDLQKAEVSFEDGLLRVVVPPVEEAPEPEPKYIDLDIK